MNIHHTKHHQAYVTNLNGALDKHPELKGISIVDVCKSVSTDKIPADVATVVSVWGRLPRPAVRSANALSLQVHQPPHACAHPSWTVLFTM